MKEKQNWASERPKLENVRRVRGIYFIDPEEREYKDIIKNAQKKIAVTSSSSHAL